MTADQKTKPPELDPERVRDISEHVYRTRLGADGVRGIIAEHGEWKLRANASSYDPLTRCYLRAVKAHPEALDNAD